eukprot:5120063-Karenia_brevis.AAC.1
MAEPYIATAMVISSTHAATNQEMNFQLLSFIVRTRTTSAQNTRPLHLHNSIACPPLNAFLKMSASSSLVPT